MIRSPDVEKFWESAFANLEDFKRQLLHISVRSWMNRKKCLPTAPNEGGDGCDEQRERVFIFHSKAKGSWVIIFRIIFPHKTHFHQTSKPNIHFAVWWRTCKPRVTMIAWGGVEGSRGEWRILNMISHLRQMLHVCILMLIIRSYFKIDVDNVKHSLNEKRGKFDGVKSSWAWWS